MLEQGLFVLPYNYINCVVCDGKDPKKFYEYYTFRNLRGFHCDKHAAKFHANKIVPHLKCCLPHYDPLTKHYSWRKPLVPKQSDVFE